MARTYKDNPNKFGKRSKGRRNDRGDNRGRRWNEDDGNAFSFSAPRRTSKRIDLLTGSGESGEIR
jgi:hypothetical protein